MRGTISQAYPTNIVSKPALAIIAMLSLLLATVSAQSQQVATSQPVLAADSDVLQRLREAHGGARLAHTDFVVEARVTLQTPNGPVVVPVTILRSSAGGQRIQFKQSDGKPWDGTIPHLEANTRRILEFVQTQYDRALPSILHAGKRKVEVFDGGIKDGTQFLNVRDTGVVGMKEGTPLLNVRESDVVATRYDIDAKTSRLGRMEFQHRITDAAGKITTNIETYTYSDFRSVTEIATPFQIEHYTNGVKKEDLVIASVRAIPINPSLAIRGGPRQ
jgi:hypothetical protein